MSFRFQRNVFRFDRNVFRFDRIRNVFRFHRNVLRFDRNVQNSSETKAFVCETSHSIMSMYFDIP